MMDLAAADAELLRGRGAIAPDVALVLGSGLGGLADAVDDAVVVPTSELKGYPTSTVAGHAGRLVLGRMEDVPIVIAQGRVHLYEGHSIAQVTYPVRLLHALGARRLVLTNAAGAVNAALRPGTLMLITDHINFAGAHLTRTGGHPKDAARHGSVRVRRDLYTKAWLDRTEERSLRDAIAVRRGTYVWVRGPSYETKAEIAFLRRIGADAVGMSTVPEALQASALGMDVLGISTITNPAAGLGTAALSHEDVLAAARRVRTDLERLIRGVIRER